MGSEVSGTRDLQEAWQWGQRIIVLKDTQSLFTFFFFYIFLLLRRNLHTKFTDFKWRIQFDKCIQLCNPMKTWTIQKVPFALFQSIPLYPRHNHCSDLYHHRLALPVLEMHICGITQCIRFYLWLLSPHIMLLRLIHIVVLISSSLFFIAEQ